MTISSRKTFTVVALSAALLGVAAVAAPAQAIADTPATFSETESSKYRLKVSDASISEEEDGQVVATATFKCREGWEFGLALELVQEGTATGYALISGTCTGDKQSETVPFQSENRFEQGSATLAGAFAAANDERGIFFKVSQSIEIN